MMNKFLTRIMDKMPNTKLVVQGTSTTTGTGTTTKAAEGKDSMDEVNHNMIVHHDVDVIDEDEEDDEDDDGYDGADENQTSPIKMPVDHVSWDSAAKTHKKTTTTDTTNNTDHHHHHHHHYHTHDKENESNAYRNNDDPTTTTTTTTTAAAALQMMEGPSPFSNKSDTSSVSMAPLSPVQLKYHHGDENDDDHDHDDYEQERQKGTLQEGTTTMVTTPNVTTTIATTTTTTTIATTNKHHVENDKDEDGDGDDDDDDTNISDCSSISPARSTPQAKRHHQMPMSSSSSSPPSFRQEQQPHDHCSQPREGEHHMALKPSVGGRGGSLLPYHDMYQSTTDDSEGYSPVAARKFLEDHGYDDDDDDDRDLQPSAIKPSKTSPTLSISPSNSTTPGERRGMDDKLDQDESFALQALEAFVNAKHLLSQEEHNAAALKLVQQLERIASPLLPTNASKVKMPNEIAGEVMSMKTFDSNSNTTTTKLKITNDTSKQQLDQEEEEQLQKQQQQQEEEEEKEQAVQVDDDDDDRVDDDEKNTMEAIIVAEQIEPAMDTVSYYRQKDCTTVDSDDRPEPVHVPKDSHGPFTSAVDGNDNGAGPDDRVMTTTTTTVTTFMATTPKASHAASVITPEDENEEISGVVVGGEMEPLTMERETDQEGDDSDDDDSIGELPKLPTSELLVSPDSSNVAQQPTLKSALVLATPSPAAIVKDHAATEPFMSPSFVETVDLMAPTPLRSNTAKDTQQLVQQTVSDSELSKQHQQGTVEMVQSPVDDTKSVDYLQLVTNSSALSLSEIRSSSTRSPSIAEGADPPPNDGGNDGIVSHTPRTRKISEWMGPMEAARNLVSWPVPSMATTLRSTNTPERLSSKTRQAQDLGRALLSEDDSKVPRLGTPARWTPPTKVYDDMHVAYAVTASGGLELTNATPQTDPRNMELRKTQSDWWVPRATRPWVDDVSSPLSLPRILGSSAIANNEVSDLESPNIASPVVNYDKFQFSEEESTIESQEFNDPADRHEEPVAGEVASSQASDIVGSDKGDNHAYAKHVVLQAIGHSVLAIGDLSPQSALTISAGCPTDEGRTPMNGLAVQAQRNPAFDVKILQDIENPTDGDEEDVVLGPPPIPLKGRYAPIVEKYKVVHRSMPEPNDEDNVLSSNSSEHSDEDLHDKHQRSFHWSRRWALLFVLLAITAIVVATVLATMRRSDSSSTAVSDENLDTAATELPTLEPVASPTTAPSFVATDSPSVATTSSPTTAPTQFFRTASPSTSNIEVRPTPTTPEDWSWDRIENGEDIWRTFLGQLGINTPRWYLGGNSAISSGLQLEIVNAAEERYASSLSRAVGDFRASRAIVSLDVTSVPYEDLCEPSMGKIKVCSGDFGVTDWTGSSILFLRDGLIMAAVIRINSASRSTLSTSFLQHSICHQLGHTLGIAHQNDGISCLQDLGFDEPTVVDGGGPIVSDQHQRPNEDDLERLVALYGPAPSRRLRERSVPL